MSLLRLIGNIVRLSIYVPVALFLSIPRILGSYPVLIAWLGVTYYVLNLNRFNIWVYLGFLAWAFFRAMRQIAGPIPKFRLLRGPPPPPPPPASAVTAQGRADDPNEKTVIGRLDPKLRELLRQKPDSAAS